MGFKINVIPFRAPLLILTIAILVAVFQNCQVADHANQNNSKDSSTAGTVPNGGGNGEGYTGLRQLFVHELPTGTCADGNPVQDAIAITDAGPILIRQNCLDLAQPLPVEVIFSVDQGSLTYAGDAYSNAKPNANSDTPNAVSVDARD